MTMETTSAISSPNADSGAVQLEQHAQRSHDGGNQNGAYRHAAFVDVQQRFRRISLKLGQTEYIRLLQ